MSRRWLMVLVVLGSAFISFAIIFIDHAHAASTQSEDRYGDMILAVAYVLHAPAIITCTSSVLLFSLLSRNCSNKARFWLFLTGLIPLGLYLTYHIIFLIDEPDSEFLSILILTFGLILPSYFYVKHNEESS